MIGKFFWLRGFGVAFVALCALALIAPLARADAPTGGAPGDPLAPPSDWQLIPANTTRWFYLDYGADRVKPKINVAIDTRGIGEMHLAIFTPALAQEWLREPTTSPIGRGTPYRDTRTGNVTRDLYWSGAFNVSDRYLAALTNNNPFGVFYRMTVTGDTVNLPPAFTPTPTATPPITLTPVALGSLTGKIVFQDALGGVIYVVNGDGSNLRAVSRGIDPAWSPDGKQIAFARWDNVYPGLYVVNADGSNERMVFGAPRIRSPRWSPNGKLIAFTQDKSAGTGAQTWRLGVFNLETSADPDNKISSLTEPQCATLCLSPTWKNDGTQLAYIVPGDGIFQSDVRTGFVPEDRSLAPKLILGPSGSYWDTRAEIPRPILDLPPLQSTAWNSTGTQIAFTLRAHDRWEINVVNADGTNARGITQPDPFLYTFWGVKSQNVAPVWSPDTKQILYLSDRNGRWEFFVMNADGSNVRQVLKNVTDLVKIRFDFELERVMDWTR